MKFTKMLPPACQSGASGDVRQPIMMLTLLMEVLVLEELESLTQRVPIDGRPKGGNDVGIDNPDGRVAEGVCRD